MKVTREQRILQENKEFKEWWSANGKIRPIKIDVKECRKGALKRHLSFDGKNSKRVFPEDKIREELTGYCGEVAFEELTGYPMKREEGPDGGIDFTLPEPIGPINVKCTERWKNLLIKEKDPLHESTNFVIASYVIKDENTGWVYFIGVTKTSNISIRYGFDYEYFENTYTSNLKKLLWRLTPMKVFVDALISIEKRNKMEMNRKDMYLRGFFND